MTMGQQMQVRKSVTAKINKEIISKHESRTSVRKQSVKYGMPKSAICTILKNKD